MTIEEEGRRHEPSGPATGDAAPESLAEISKATGFVNHGVGAVQKLTFGQQEVPVSYWLTTNGDVATKLHWTKSAFAAQPGREAAFEGLAGAGKALGHAGHALNVCSRALDQWGEDGEQFSDAPVVRGARSAYRTGIVVGAGFVGGQLGGKAGAISGAAIGTMVAPGPGTVVGAVLGHIGGSTAAATVATKAAEAFVDRTIDSVETAVSTVEDAVESLQEAADELVDGIVDSASAKVSAIRNWFS